MYIRLILTIRDNTPFLSRKIHRKTIINTQLLNHINFEILSLAYTYGENKIDLIVTPHNFFSFKLNTTKQVEDINNKIFEKMHQIMQELHSKLANKQNLTQLIMGIDLIQALSNDYYCFNSYFNPYSGIDSIVAYFKNTNNRLELSNYIWESWYSKGQCDKTGFLKQNNKRAPIINGTQFCLLSCGDIFSYCHCYGGILPVSNVYLNLAHNDYKPVYIYEKNDKKGIIKSQIKPKLFNFLKNCNKNTNFTLLITQNFSYNNRNDIFYNNKYLYVWPNDKIYRIYYFNSQKEKVEHIVKEGFIFIDVIL